MKCNNVTCISYARMGCMTTNCGANKDPQKCKELKKFQKNKNRRGKK